LDGTPTVTDYTQTLQLTAGVPDAGGFDHLYPVDCMTTSQL